MEKLKELRNEYHRKMREIVNEEVAEFGLMVIGIKEYDHLIKLTSVVKDLPHSSGSGRIHVMQGGIKKSLKTFAQDNKLSYSDVKLLARIYPDSSFILRNASAERKLKDEDDDTASIPPEFSPFSKAGKQ